MFRSIQRKQIFNSESGVSLIVAVMTLFVLSIIGVTIATVTFANIKLSTTDREYQSTYYIAEAGVNQTYAEIKDLIISSYNNTNTEVDFYAAVEPVLLADINNSVLTNFEPSFGEKPTANISITKIDDGNPRTYRISSEGQIGERHRTVSKEFTVNWIPKAGGGTPMPALPEGVAAIIKNNVNLSGSGTIDGDLYLDTELNNRIKVDGGAGITGDIYVKDPNNDAIFDMPDWMTKPTLNYFGFEFDWEKLERFFDSFPTAPSLPLHEDVKIVAGSNQHDVIKNGNLYINNYLIRDENFVLNLDQNYHFNRATFGGNYTLKINIGNSDRVLVFDELHLTNGHIEIIGTGNLTIFVKNELKFGSRPRLNFGGRTDQLTIYYEGAEKVDFTTVDINANILVKRADVTYGAGGGREGLLVSGGNYVSVANGAEMDSIIVAPFAKVHLSGNKTLGVVIAEELEITGGTKLEYKQVDTSKFPFDFITVPNEPSNPGSGDSGDLLIPKPNIE
ncbi:pilus assembly PilX N-terminal domain-containing protein [Amphibacillus xylanus]|uniref:Type 4 fimbrial biogenesis protein PilX N-terminal domain-containing protein n=1 Tax=Amphibacillus xylanus (strain ATCC 51415 / DSM 6626 / JCM 7361 / LMG 17667 / NBRC 15112 / Ep01) TaxID=698758 RepID=K0IXN0_AMPXN|nr:pilus assembly PilX N-terminal domain-containing protein [Amphibacillus xylanus]BAM47134.1 hypothetical protein AXY_10020 [Amphibacillus xylanus NBRC 15112]